jgi:murein DD-endopeptidase MepM/ murein hydrolase activator NlpD
MIVGSLLVSVGQTVTVGQQVGSLGSTGQSTGPHLHFEILLGGTAPTDPLAWLGAHATA